MGDILNPTQSGLIPIRKNCHIKNLFGARGEGGLIPSIDRVNLLCQCSQLYRLYTMISDIEQCYFIPARDSLPWPVLQMRP